MALPLVLVVAHFVADFLCQTDWMALNKSKRWDALTAHVLVYAGVLAMFLVPCVSFNVALGGGLSLFIAVNFVAHWVQDAITSRINARLWFLKMTPCGKGAILWGKPDNRTAYFVDDTGARHWFFVGIGADQMLHYITLFVTADWWLR